MTEADLEDLLDFIAGRGRFTAFGDGMHTYPGRDENQKGLHDGCLELERRGLIVRTINTPDHCAWRTTECDTRLLN